MTAPKVFISHASEDKARFVLPFAERLRASGVDAWVDRWEMLPGDSLIDKLFEEGLKKASAVLVVLSASSVNKPWVREELNTAAVSRITKGTKLIPVVIDDCQVPTVLQSLLWERVDDLQSYDNSFDRIVAAIFGATDKPPLGSPPSYVRSIEIGSLSKLDSFVLKVACDYCVTERKDLLEPQSIYCHEGKFSVPEGELLDSLQVLEEKGYIDVSHVLGSRWGPFRVTTYGFDQYAEACIANYPEVTRAVAAALVNQKLSDNESIALAIAQPIRIVNHVLDVLESNQLLKQSKQLGVRRHVFTISPSLKRALQT